MINIIPAIDIINGECVRLTCGEYDSKTVYYKNPADAARLFMDAGVRTIHMVDLDGAKSSFPKNLPILEKVAATGADIQYGGGIKSDKALSAVFNSGASRAICGSIAVKAPMLFRKWLLEYGGEKIVLGADHRKGLVATDGWLEDSQAGVVEVIDDFLPCGLTRIICTDISRDGTLQGPDLEFYRNLQRLYPLADITLSGGVSSVGDLYEAKKAGLKSIIIGKAFYEGKITINDIRECLRNE